MLIVLILLHQCYPVLFYLSQTTETTASFLCIFLFSCLMFIFHKKTTQGNHLFCLTLVVLSPEYLYLTSWKANKHQSDLRPPECPATCPRLTF